MARTAFPDSASSQFFICVEELPYLDGQYAAFGKTNKKLTVGGIRIHRASHRNRAAQMRPTVKFGFQFFAAAAGSGAERTTGLRHKTVDHAMKFQPVVKSRALCRSAIFHEIIACQN